ncbi:MAG: PAS domain S-box protein, partial [Phycisphaeraceae bacterium]
MSRVLRRILQFDHHPLLRRIIGPVIMAGAVALLLQLDLASRHPVAPAAVLLSLVALATFLGGLTSGMISAAVSILYFADFYGVISRGDAGNTPVLELATITLSLTLLLHLLQRRTLARERDLAARQEAEASGRQMEKLIQGLDAIVWQVDVRTGQLRFISRQAERLLGYPYEQWMENPTRLLERIVHPRDRERVMKRYRADTARPGNEVLEYRIFAADGREIWLRDLIRLEHDAEGRATLAGVAVDITARRRTEAELRHSQAHLQAVLDILPVGVLIIDRRGRVLETNPALKAMSGGQIYPTLESASANLHGRHPDTGEPIPPGKWGLLRALHHAETVLDEEVEIETPDGKRKIVLNSALPIRDSRGEIAGAVAVNVDITDLKRTQQELSSLNATLEQRVAERTALAEQQADQLRALAGELSLTEERERRRLAQVLHDHLQQLLVAAKMRLSLLGEELDTSHRHAAEEVQELLGESIEASRSLTVELSPPVLHDAGLGPALEWLGRHYEKEYGLAVEATFDRQAEPERSDLRFLLFQAARELLFNTVKHARASQAWVSLTRTAGGEVRLVVEDDGDGFEPGRKKPGSSQSSFGLFSIRERLRLIGGRMDICTAPGEGTCIRVVVPLDPGEAAPLAADEPAADEPCPKPNQPCCGNGQCVRVLLVDDHQILRQGLARLLAAQKQIDIVGEASTAGEGIALARELHPDVVLMDVTLPDLTGIEATRRLGREVPEVQVIGLSMHEQQDMAAAMRDAGAIAYFSKAG